MDSEKVLRALIEIYAKQEGYIISIEKEDKKWENVEMAKEQSILAKN